ncbi:hypothetical protein NDN08_003983 [Rhodosorus marinus]|uniref:Major facilitator superfamily (MFS) profile domain-containing protein n=1 Tax=Rhodosorus marinus TaxID=101924 RepID=A0AAV8UKS3_9RHOD|nr:hypothetical protein NDN08_003983 [Rhodosorus marinus]
MTSPGVDLARRRWAVYVPATLLIMLPSGVPFSLGILASGLSDHDPLMVPAFVSGLGVRSFVSAVFVLLGSLLLDTRPESIQVLGIIGLALCALHVLVGYGIQHGVPYMIYLGNSLFGISNGLFYIIGVIHAAAWIPELPSLAMGLCFGALGAGAIVGAIVLDLLVRMWGVVQATYAISVTLLILFGVGTVGLRMPPFSWDPRSDSEALVERNLAYSGTRLGNRIFLHHQVYLMMIIVAAGTGPAFGFYTAFSNVARGVIGMSAETANLWFVAMNFVVLIGRFGGGYLVNFCGFGRGFFWSGAKNLTILLMAAQTLASILVVRAEEEASASLFLVAVGIYFLTFASESTLAAVLARHVFSAVNGGIVFGFSMVSSGLATMAFSLLMASGLQQAATSGSFGVEMFKSYNDACTVVSIIGLIASLLITSCKAATEDFRLRKDPDQRYGSV